MGIETKGEWEQSADISWIAKLKTKTFKRLLIMNRRRINKQIWSNLFVGIKRKYSGASFLFYEPHFTLEISNRNF